MKYIPEFLPAYHHRMSSDANHSNRINRIQDPNHRLQNREDNYPNRRQLVEKNETKQKKTINKKLQKVFSLLVIADSLSSS